MEKNKSKNGYVLYCDFCGTKTPVRKSEMLSDFTEVATAKVPGGVPTYDPEKKVVVAKESQQRARIFRCKKCGRGMPIRKSHTPFFVGEEVKDEKDIDAGRESGTA